MNNSRFPKFNPIPAGKWNDTRDIAVAWKIASDIMQDVLNGEFDPTLEKYRLPNSALRHRPRPLLETWDAWVKSLGLPPETEAVHYQYIRSMIVKADPKLTDTQWLLESHVSARTFNDRLHYLRSFGSWAVEKGYLETNHWKKIKPRTAAPKALKPFTFEEMQRIIEGFNELAPHYTSFIKFLLMTGVRTSEAAGLCWRHVDFDRNQIIINESLSIDRAGNGYQKKRKPTKTSNIRYLNMNKHLRQLLESLYVSGAKSEQLVFTTVRGKPIDSRYFRKAFWAKILEAKSIDYRKPYNTRHTMISHAIEQGIPITGVAYLAGHKDTRMVMTTYGHMINRPELPDLNIFQGK